MTLSEKDRIILAAGLGILLGTDAHWEIRPEIQALINRLANKNYFGND
jgi:hypothetical protein